MPVTINGTTGISTPGLTNSSGDMTITNGNLVLGTSGKGIDFSATSGTGTSELLADYEEGTFTPTISGSSSAGTGTYSIQVGVYTKVGRQVSISIWVAWSAHTGTGNLQITNLPFSSSATTDLYNAVTIGYANNLALTANNVVIAHNPNNSSRIDFYQYAVGGGANSAVAIDTGASIIVSATYFV